MNLRGWFHSAKPFENQGGPTWDLDPPKLRCSKGDDSARKSQWDATTLTQQQKTYAAVDVALSLRLYEVIKQRMARCRRGDEHGFMPKDHVRLLTSGHTACVACGVVVHPLASSGDQDVVRPHAAFVKIAREDVLAPGAICPFLDKTFGELMASLSEEDIMVVLWPRVDLRMDEGRHEDDLLAHMQVDEDEDDASGEGGGDDQDAISGIEDNAECHAYEDAFWDEACQHP